MIAILTFLFLLVNNVSTSPIYSFMHHHISQGTHETPDVPIEIRGTNFTSYNLEKYFDNKNPYVESYEIYPLSENNINSDEIITIGKETWKFVEDNKPVVNVKTDYTGAIPKSVSTWTKMTGWKNIEKGPYNIRWINGFNTETVRINFKWSGSYGGSYNNKGKYVTQAGPVVGSVHVAWGYTVDVDVMAFNPLNVGTEENPIGQIDIELKSRMFTILNDSMNNCRVRFVGNGIIKNVHCNL